jgi:hypothetical protein
MAVHIEPMMGAVLPAQVEAVPPERQQSKLALLQLALGIQQGEGDGQEFYKTLEPATYLKASGEVLFFCFSCSMAITAIWNPAILKSNLLKDRIGYNNVCVGFDTAPAKYFASPLITFACYLAMRYVWEDSERVKIQVASGAITSKQARMSRIANLMYFVSTWIFPLTLIIPPVSSASVWAHSLCFIQLIVARLFAVWANFNEAPLVSTKEKIFMRVYAVVSILFPLCLMVDYIAYDNGDSKSRQKPLIPTPVTAIFDYTWFICLAVTTKFLPEAPPITFEYSLTRHGKEYNKVVAADPVSFTA